MCITRQIRGIEGGAWASGGLESRRGRGSWLCRVGALLRSALVVIAFTAFGRKIVELPFRDVLWISLQWKKGRCKDKTQSDAYATIN